MNHDGFAKQQPSFLFFFELYIIKIFYKSINDGVRRIMDIFITFHNTRQCIKSIKNFLESWTISDWILSTQFV